MGWMPLSPPRAIPGTGQNLTVGAASVSSTAVGSETHMVRLSATTNCHVRTGNGTVTAVATDMLVKTTDGPLIIGIGPGDKIAVIEDSAAGTLNIVEMTY